MRSIKNLTIPTTHSQKAGLSSIQSTAQNPRTKREKVITQCAFHPSQIITNFCKNQNCLLPLCPRCVKIHVQEHAQLGTLARFQIIDDCLDQAHESILNIFAQASKMQKLSLKIQQDYCAKKQKTLKQFERVKIIAFEYLSQAFKAYQQALLIHLSKQDKSFTQTLIEYHSTMSNLMQLCRNSTKKFSSKQTIMQGLITFNSKYNLSQQLKHCQQKLSKLSITKLQISMNQSELCNFDTILKKYVKIGDSSTNIGSMVVDRSVEDRRRKIVGVGEYGWEGDGDGAYGDGVEWRDYLGLRTKLDQFSIQRSRNTRLTVQARKGYVEQIDNKIKA